MFENLRRAFKEAVDNFKTELNRDEVPEAVDRLLKGMEREATDVKANLEGLRSQMDQARARAEKEAAEAETCRRREEMARGIGDEETARIAAEYAEKHLNRCKVLTEKADAIQAEIELQEREFAQMVEQIKEARKNRNALAAQAGRAQARDSITGADDLFGELDRMAEKITGEGHAAEAARSASGDYLDADDFDEALGQRGEDVLDARLEELKRRMGES
ncbi:MAG: hypothetical protein HKN73_04090 [Gemmatimonadetes bacterium]|nr:hypothetical protein [Gemmatimonadota bacterium]